MKKFLAPLAFLALLAAANAQTVSTQFGIYANALRGQLPGTTTNDAATAGNIGEFISSEITSGSAVTQNDATATQITTISVTAGDWNIGGTYCFDLGGAVTTTVVIGNILSTSATISGATPSNSIRPVAGFTVTGGASLCFALPTRRISLSGTTSYYLNGYVDVGSGNSTGYGWLWALRVR